MATNQNELEEAARKYFTLKRERDVTRAQAYVGTTGTRDERVARALLSYNESEMYVDFVGAEASYEALKLAQRSLSDRASIGQSILRAQGRG